MRLLQLAVYTSYGVIDDVADSCIHTERMEDAWMEVRILRRDE